MSSNSAFKWRHFLPEIILWGVRWYCLFPISYRQARVIRKGQVQGVAKGDMRTQTEFVCQIFGVAA
jgi:hypothetical protein